MDSKRAASIASEVNTSHVGSHLDLVGKVDAVTVATPTEKHFDVTKDLLNKGISVLVEKPITSTVEQAEELIDIAKKQGLTLQVGHLERFNPAVKALKENIGKPLFVESQRLGPFKERARAVDVVMDLMIHDIDILLHIVEEMPYMVEAMAVPVISDSPDLANARLKFPSGCVADLTVSRVSLEEHRRLRVFGIGMYAAVNYATQRLFIAKIDKNKANLGNPMEGISRWEIELPQVDQIEEEIKSFVKSVSEGREAEVPGTEATRALKVAQSVLASAEDHLKSIQFDKLANG